jgi:hypothetical protein
VGCITGQSGFDSQPGILVSLSFGAKQLAHDACYSPSRLRMTGVVPPKEEQVVDYCAYPLYFYL